MSHSHGPGQQSYTHSAVGPAQPAQPGQSQPQAQQYVPPPLPDPKLQAIIEADFKPVNLKLGPPNNSHALLNALARLFVANPSLVVPPPAQFTQPQRSQAVNKTKQDGNTLFKAKKIKEAISMYTMAISVAAQRLPWEPNAIMREEISTLFSNRSAAYVAAGDHTSALVDAEVVIQAKRPWSKGHFRKAKALVELSRLEEARDAIKLGLAFEPENTELKAFLDDIDNRIEKRKA